ncbi:hypothetical protein HRbin15_02452 [bacterium HR15]|nr:hypothetical protein HRbin15_02452 [bacterium HR15]
MELFLVEVTFEASYPPVLAIYCSDGRYAEACDWFIEHQLGEPRFDQFAVPGGAAWLCLDYDRVWEYELARRYLQFLIRAHRIQRVILIAHENCGFYRERGVPPDKMHDQQVADLHTARRVLTDWFPHLRVESFFAQPIEGRVGFIHIT